MRSESRLRALSRRLTYVTVWYSTLLTCLTVYQLVALKDTFRDATSAALAIAMLALSMFVPSLNLDQQADRFRECYLKLQRLLDVVADDEALATAYYDVLDAYPNHPPTDRTDFIVSSYLNGQEVKSSGKAIVTTWAMLVSHWFRQVCGIGTTILASLAPALLYFLL